jgi:hypothetical protein
METPIILGIAAAVPIVLIWLLNLKTSRPDGTFVKNLHKYRQMMFYIMPTRNESVVYFDEYVDAEKLLEYLPKAAEQFGTDVDVTHATVAACALGFAENPRMNQFVKGYRLYERDGIWLSFSMKRKQLDKKAKLSVVKQRIDPHMTFRDFCEEINAKINVERSGKKTYADKEYDLFTAIPRPLLYRFVKLFRQIDYWNLLPASFIENDPMYTSMFIANLGSLKMDAGFHHLYEWGTCPLFLMVGQIREKPVVEDGEVVVKKLMHLRFSYDERVDDGLNAGHGIRTFKEVLEDPYTGLGCLEDDGSDAWPLATAREDRAT